MDTDEKNTTKHPPNRFLFPIRRQGKQVTGYMPCSQTTKAIKLMGPIMDMT